MSSIPPPACRSTPPPQLDLPSGSGETRLFFSLEGAPPQACATQAWQNGIEFDTSVAGEVVAVHRNGLDLRCGESVVALRHLLPPALDLAPLSGRWLAVRLHERFEQGRWTRQLEIRDLRGRPLLVARDGRLPADGSVLGLTLRVSLQGDDARLAIGNAPQLNHVGVGVPLRLRAENVALDLLALRLGPEDAALLWVAR